MFALPRLLLVPYSVVHSTDTLVCLSLRSLPDFQPNALAFLTQQLHPPADLATSKSLTVAILLEQHADAPASRRPFALLDGSPVSFTIWIWI